MTAIEFIYRRRPAVSIKVIQPEHIIKLCARNISMIVVIIRGLFKRNKIRAKSAETHGVEVGLDAALIVKTQATAL